MKLVYILLSICTLQIQTACLAQSSKLVYPQYLKAAGYAAHVELKWENQHLFNYQIFRSTNNGKSFTLCTQTTGSSYLDFPTDVKAPCDLVYRVVPVGLDIKDKEAAKFEVKTALRVMTDNELLDMVEQYTARYFIDFAHPATGMARERSNNDNGDIVTTGGTGFGIMAILAQCYRGHITREATLELINRIVTFLEKAERFHGAWAHWYNGNTGKVFNFSPYDDGGDLVETAFLTQGLLTARSFFINGNEQEKGLSNRITNLWETIEWDWYTQGSDSLYWHWSKNHGWKMNHRIKGYDETLITYILAASSPTHPIKPSVYHACYTNSSYFKNGKSYYGIKLDLGMELGGPLFFTHYSFLGLNPRNLSDTYANYFERNRAHVLIHHAYAIDNPQKHKDYGNLCWGFTSSDDPIVGYTSHHPGTPYENGTISPTAAIASIPYAPEICMPTITHFYYDLGKQIWGPMGFYDAYNPGLVEGQQVVRSYLAIDQGPIAVMIENYRSGYIWQLFAQNNEISTGLKALGFSYINQQ